MSHKQDGNVESFVIMPYQRFRAMDQKLKKTDTDEEPPVIEPVETDSRSMSPPPPPFTSRKRGSKTGSPAGGGVDRPNNIF